MSVACRVEYITSSGRSWRPARLGEICLLSRGWQKKAGDGDVVGMKSKLGMNLAHHLMLVIHIQN